ncbi:MAG TPA: PD-(D/E)XK nuclease family protein [Thermoanaerobaculia bacterium]|nr:PD-(D/E)XK nuclease family protein [Thermoanaerobaculia bacterium]
MPLQLSLFDVLAEPPRPPGGRILIASGPLAAEALLLEHLDSLLAEIRRDPSRLARPVRIVVPSRSLRLHLSAALVRRRGRSAAGVSIQTLFGLASEVLERAGEVVPRGTRLFEVLAQRAARAEPVLRRGLEDLADGFSAVTGTVRDLLDAGLEPVHAEAAEEALASDGPRVASRAEVERARALVRAAARAEDWMRELGLGRASTLLRRAAELVETAGDRHLPAEAVLIHGFADATGVATDFLEALLKKRGAWLILDHPPKPEGGGAERSFSDRFFERLSHSASSETTETAAGPSRVQAVEAVGTEAEVREIAARVRGLLDRLDRGARPEGIGIVARDLGPFRLALRRHFDRLGIPFSGVGERGGLTPAGRRIRAFLELLRQGEAVPSDRWLDGLAALPPLSLDAAGSRVDLRLAFYSLGAGRLRDVAELPVEELLRNNSYPLPIRQGLKTVGDGNSDGDGAGDAEGEGDGSQRRQNEAHARRRRVSGSLLRVAVRAARRTRDRLATWPQEAPLEIHLTCLEDLLNKDLNWDAGSEEARPVVAALDELEREVPARLRLGREEVRLLLEGLLEEAGTSELGGQGGGVQVLSVVEARGRTFDHLFLLGLNRDVFPRGIREDPLMTDDLRRILRRVLPDVPVKRSGFDEERYLFAQLLSASPSVTLSWQTADDDGKPVSPSPLAERLRERIRIEKAPPLWALPAAGPLPGPRMAAEHALMAGLHAPRRWFGRVLPLAIEEGRAELAHAAFDLPPARLAAARLAVLEEMDPDLRTPEGRSARSRLGPYFGFIGRLPGGGEGEPRLRELYVTQLENLAACPWQLFLVRLLRIEPTPDPLGALPGVDAVLLGNVVHATLERIARPPEPPPARSALRGAPPFSIAWPAEDDVSRMLREEAVRLLADEGIRLPGLAHALAERARPMLDTARDVDWAAGELAVLATEHEGELDVGEAPGRLHRVLFQADRVDLRRGGLVVWTDYKTGRPISNAKRAETRRRDFLNRVRSGSNLQAVAYLLGSEGDSMGRYLFLRPGIPEDAREVSVTHADEEFIAAFAAASEAVLAAWEEGSFFPRLVEPDGRNEPGRCSYCSVAEACLRGDSGSRQRLSEWTAGTGGPGSEEEALLRVWRLWEKQLPEGAV